MRECQFSIAGSAARALCAGPDGVFKCFGCTIVALREENERLRKEMNTCVWCRTTRDVSPVCHGCYMET